MIRKPFTAFLLISLPAFALAATYQWVDENGVTVYSQFPPANQEQAKQVAPPPPPANPQAAQQLQELQQQLEDRREDRDLAARKKQEETKNQATRAENCRRARQNLLILQQRSRQLIKQADGSYRRYTPEEKEKEIARHESVISRDCQ